MINKVLAFALFGIVAIQAASSPAMAATPPGCRATSLPRGVLYKGENVHGGRGRSLILSCNVYHNIQGLSGTLPIIDAKGKSLGNFRMYDPGHTPYGRRYYAYGTANRNVPAFIKVGSACWAISNLGSRQGSVSITSGNHGC